MDASNSESNEKNMVPKTSDQGVFPKHPEVNVLSTVGDFLPGQVEQGRTASFDLCV